MKKTTNSDFKHGIAKPMLGAVLSKTITINVEVLKLEKEIPTDEIAYFNEWLIHKGIELGIGKQHEYYDYTDNVKDAIAVTFRVYCT